MRMLPGALAIALTGCGGAPVANEANAAPSAANVAAPAAPSADEARYVGRWIGVEGTVLDVARRPGGGLTLDMQYDLDNRGRFVGRVTPGGIAFERNGVAETAVPSDGNATGLKYLAGKTDCLTVKPGEGYCRG